MKDLAEGLMKDLAEGLLGLVMLAYWIFLIVAVTHFIIKFW
jgi:hypothetical protein